MKNIILLFIAILPVYIILAYIYKKDKEKESRKLLTKLFSLGILSAIPAIILEIIATIILGDPKYMEGIELYIYCLLGVALIEEICKWFFLYKNTYYHKEFDHIYDAIVYAVFISLGFAAFENIFYVSEYGIATGLVRAVSSIPGHACFAVIMGNYFSLAKIADLNNNKKLSNKNLIKSIIIPTLLHGMYDYCLYSENEILFLIFLLFITSIYIYSYIVIKKLSNIKNNFIDNNLF